MAVYWKCEVCGYEAQNEDQKTEHMKMHEGAGKTPEHAGKKTEQPGGPTSR